MAVTQAMRDATTVGQLSTAADADVAALAAEHEIDLLVLRKRDWIGWERWLAEPTPAIRVVYDDGEFLVFDLHPDRAPASR